MTAPSRPARMRTIEKEVRQLAAEYLAWFEALPENLGESAMAEKLEETIEVLESVADEIWAITIDPPCIGM
ncbi:MAG TPA: hypothetical protein DD435_01080 [Cyanobacteria bacterium UBA8530]|nr:hypothetical protein [Cyanobacteria bacterium UBA8530]